jgi:hypothetical protein
MEETMKNVFLVFLFLYSCSNKTFVAENVTATEETKPFYTGRNIYETEEEYINALYDIDYFQYRRSMLYRCMEKNDFSYFETEMLDNDHLVGNQVDNDYMEIIREVIHIKNNLTFGNNEIDDYFRAQYEYYDPENPQKLTSAERNILLQINSILFPREEKVAVDEISKIIEGVWQKNDYNIAADYKDTLGFSDTNMAIKTNRMDSSRRFREIEGTYKIINNNIVMNPEHYDYINGGRFVFADKDGLIKEYYGAETEKITLSPNGIISYPIISISKVYNEFENRHYYKLVLFIDKPVIYYKVSER